MSLCIHPDRLYTQQFVLYCRVFEYTLQLVVNSLRNIKSTPGCRESEQRGGEIMCHFTPNLYTAIFLHVVQVLMEQIEIMELLPFQY